MKKMNFLLAYSITVAVYNTLDDLGIPLDLLLDVSCTPGPQSKLIKEVIFGSKLIDPRDYPSIFRLEPTTVTYFECPDDKHTHPSPSQV